VKINEWINNVSALQFFQLLRFSVLVLISILLVKGGYSKEEITVYELFFFISNFISFAWVMGFKNGLLSYFDAKAKDERPRLIFNIALIYILCSLLFVLILWALKEPIAVSWLERDSIPFLSLIMLYLVFNAPTILNELILLLHDRSKEIIRYGLLLFVTQFIGIASLIAIGASLSWLFWFMIVLAGFKLIYTFVLLFRFSQFKIDFKLARSFIVFSIPLCLHMLVGNGMEFVDGFLVTSHFEDGDFAIFRYGARELPLVTIWIGALTSAMIPIAVKNYESALIELKTSVNRLMNWLFPISALLMLGAPFIFEWVYSAEFAASAIIFNIYLLILTNRIILVQVVLFSKHANKVLLYAGMAELVLNITLSLILLNYFGLFGIAFATVIAYFLNKIILFLYSRKRFKLQLSQILPVKSYLLWTICLVLCFILSIQYA